MKGDGFGQLYDSGRRDLTNNLKYQIIWNML